jgi:hypothetical protein
MHRSDTDLENILLPLAKKHRYGSLKAGFKDTRDLTASWRPGFNSLEMYISDYLDDAPEPALLEFAESIILIANGKKAGPMPEYISWVTSDRFIIKKRETFIARSKNMTENHKGKTYDLADSVQRLLDNGMILPPDISNSFFSWTSRPNYRKVGSCSPLMRVVTVSCAMDSPDVPENVLDYVVYHEILHLRQGYRPFQRSHDTDFKDMEKKYPGRKECDAFLRKLKQL